MLRRTRSGSSRVRIRERQRTNGLHRIALGAVVTAGTYPNGVVDVRVRVGSGPGALEGVGTHGSLYIESTPPRDSDYLDLIAKLDTPGFADSNMVFTLDEGDDPAIRRSPRWNPNSQRTSPSVRSLRCWPRRGFPCSTCFRRCGSATSRPGGPCSWTNATTTSRDASLVADQIYEFLMAAFRAQSAP